MLFQHRFLIEKLLKSQFQRGTLTVNIFPGVGKNWGYGASLTYPYHDIVYVSEIN